MRKSRLISPPASHNAPAVSPGRRWRAVRFCGFRAFLLSGAVLGVFLTSALPVPRKPPLDYTVDLRQPESHLVLMTLKIPDAEPGLELQFPAWNCLYQIRDFIRDVQELQATCDGQPEALERVGLDTFRNGKAACRELTLNYHVYANHESPFSSAFNPHHAFLNFAMLCFFLPQYRSRALQLRVILPEGWKAATLLDDAEAPNEFNAANYDVLADSPLEAGTFQEEDYQQNGATFRLVVDADEGLKIDKGLMDGLQRITAEETQMMRDTPFHRYTFIFHFRNDSGGGGMEHKYGTAITVSPKDVRRGWGVVESIAAHEFFHLWNVKRIRPQGLEPIDYVHGNDTHELWFAEGVTSTYAELSLLRCGLISKRNFYEHIADVIRVLQMRPARFFQSVETSGTEAWLEGYGDYYRPDRSISYYDKGELLGYILDLGMRGATRNQASLDDLMRALNERFAKQGKFFTDANLRMLIHVLAPEYSDEGAFFRDDVAGTRELDYANVFKAAGVSLREAPKGNAALGFLAVQAFDGPIVVESVDSGSDAEAAGIRKGDVLLAMNGQKLELPPEDYLAGMKPGQTAKFQVRRGNELLEIAFKLGATTETTYRLKESSHATPEQIAVRNGWLAGTTSPKEAAQQ
jgi:predicted metalloprotease with PDZ domain